MKEVAIVGFVQTVFFSLLILSKKDKSQKDYLLILFLLLVGCELTYRFFLFKGVGESSNWLIAFDIIYWALFGPVTYFYFQYATNRIKRFRIIESLHFLPLIFSLLVFSDYLLVFSDKLTFIQYFSSARGIRLIGVIVWEFASPIYLFYMVFLLLKHKKKTRNYFSNLSQKDFNWLLFLIAGFSFFLLCSYIFMFLRSFYHMDIGFRGVNYLPIILTIYVFIIGFYGFKQEGVFFYSNNNRQGGGVFYEGIENTSKKYEKSSLLKEEQEMLIERVARVMEEEKCYLESELTLRDLADKLGTSFHKLSQVINESFQKNFYDFVNYYRMEAAKQMLANPENERYKIMTIAYDCGFSSKSAFYNAFRKSENCTPTQYREKNLQEVETVLKIK